MVRAFCVFHRSPIARISARSPVHTHTHSRSHHVPWLRVARAQCVCAQMVCVRFNYGAEAIWCCGGKGENECVAVAAVVSRSSMILYARGDRRRWVREKRGKSGQVVGRRRRRRREKKKTHLFFLSYYYTHTHTHAYARRTQRSALCARTHTHVSMRTTTRPAPPPASSSPLPHPSTLAPSPARRALNKHVARVA